jgi:hypothetical protein
MLPDIRTALPTSPNSHLTKKAQMPKTHTLCKAAHMPKHDPQAQQSPQVYKLSTYSGRKHASSDGIDRATHLLHYLRRKLCSLLCLHYSILPLCLKRIVVAGAAEERPSGAQLPQLSQV